MATAICLLSVIPLRKEPAHKSEMVSQVLFGEYVATGEYEGDFAAVECLYDGYKGWVQTTQLTTVMEEEVFETTTYTASFATPVALHQMLVQAPYASPVYRQQGFSFSVAHGTVNYLMVEQQTWNAAIQNFNLQTLQAAYQPFINTPYLWGGKSVFGVDCSGFVQQVFKMLGVKLLRDAYLQATQGIAIETLPETLPGDLGFFCNEAGRVTHVGIIMEDHKIVHASGKVRIDTVIKEGIISSDTGRLTHTMHSVRRVL